MMTVWTWLALEAAAQVSTPTDPPEDHPKHFIIPDPGDGEGAAKAPGPRTERPSVRRNTEPSVPPRIARKVPRPVQGAAPINLHGRYHVVEVTEAGITEDYANKMERAGRALNEDCLTLRYIFDFGPLPVLPEGEVLEGHRPLEVALTRIQSCDVGGLGTYAEESTLVVAARWEEAEAATTLSLPATAMNTEYVRLRTPPEGHMRTPPQWLSPKGRFSTHAHSYQIMAEKARRDALPVLHLILDDKVLHLEADPGDSPFDQVDDPDAQAAAP